MAANSSDDRAVELFGVQGAVFADRIFDQQIEDWPRGQLELAVAMHHGARAGLVVGLNRFLGLADEGFGVPWLRLRPAIRHRDRDPS